MSVTLLPVVSEKAMGLAEKGTYVFEVPVAANKIEIARAVATDHNVKVKSVRTIVQKGKPKTYKRIKGSRVDVKKAYVTLKSGSITLYAEQK